MAEFLTALKETLAFEGGYSNDTLDNGGMTYKGISRRNFPNWGGWTIIDTLQPLKRGEVVKNTELDNSVAIFYNTNFWQKMHGDAIDSQRVAGFIFDWFVNCGGAAIKQVQEHIGLAADGICGSHTVDCINQCNEETLMDILIGARMDYYKDIAKANPQQQKFLSGWINRTQSFIV